MRNKLISIGTCTTYICLEHRDLYFWLLLDKTIETAIILFIKDMKKDIKNDSLTDQSGPKLVLS